MPLFDDDDDDDDSVRRRRDDHGERIENLERRINELMSDLSALTTALSDLDASVTGVESRVSALEGNVVPQPAIDAAVADAQSLKARLDVVAPAVPVPPAPASAEVA